MPIIPDNSLLLSERKELPDALKALSAEFPRGVWETHDNFSGLVRFWLDRHMLFRRVLEAMQQDTDAMIGNDLAPEHYKHKLARYGQMFIEQLHEHHQIEDYHYFPKLAEIESRFEQGIELLESDHHQIDAHLSAFADGVNTILRTTSDADAMEEAKRHRQLLQQTELFLNRHLEDEEDLVVPVILKHGEVSIP